MTGYFKGTATFGNITLESAGDKDIFIAKLDASGTYQWARKAGGLAGDDGESIAVLDDGSSIVTGGFQGVATFGNTTLESAGSYDIFVAKLGANGDYQWARKAGGERDRFKATSVSILDDGASIVTGYFKDDATFGNTTLTSAGSLDIFIAKLDADGEYEWVTQAGGTSTDSGYGVSVLEDGSSIVTGYFFGDATFGNTTLTSAGS